MYVYMWYIYIYIFLSLSLSLLSISIYLSIYLYIYIYLYTLSPSETYWFRFCYCVLQWFLLVSPSTAASIFFIHLKTLDVWAWWIMMFHVYIQWHILMVFASFLTTVLCSQQRVSIQTWTECARICGQTSILSFYMSFYNVFVPSCDTWNFWFCTLSDLADILFDDQHGRYVFGIFSLLCSFRLLFHYCSGSILWMMCGS